MTREGAAARARVDVYYADIRDIGEDVRELLLAEEDFARLPRIARARRRAEFLAGRALLRFALERWTGHSAREHRLRTDGRGKPRCFDGPAFSVAHEGHWVACAIAPCGDVGIDVQSVTATRAITAIADRYFAAPEADWLHGGCPERFYMLWVLKEAYLKALGVGLAGGLATLQCRIEPPLIEAISTDATTMLALYAHGSAYFGLATINCGFSEVRFERWQPAPGSCETAAVPQLVAKTT